MKPLAGILAITAVTFLSSCSKDQPQSHRLLTTTSAPDSQPATGPTSQQSETELLPGSEFDLDTAMKDLPDDVYRMHWYHPSTMIAEGKKGFTFAAVCEAISEPTGGSSHGNAQTWQEYKMVQPLVGKVHIGGSFSLYYVYFLMPGKDQQHPVKAGRRVIWIVHTGDKGEFIGVKALPDTPANRQAVVKAGQAK